MPIRLIVRGHDDTGKDLIIAGNYIARGFRHRAAELATEWRGPRTELEIQQTVQREVEQERCTSLDRVLQRLQRLGLADEVQLGTWAIDARAGKTLRALG